MTLSRRLFCIGITGYLVTGCEKTENIFEPVLEVFDESFLGLVIENSNAEVIAEGFQWAEGPTWDMDRQCLYFTDVPQNKAYRWSESSGLELFLSPSGVGQVEGFREPGANGLFFDAKAGDILLCNHGRRAIERLALDAKKRTLLVESYKGKKLNSPNDVVATSSGGIFFTDPTYGLEGLDASPLKELEFNGVYYWSSKDGIRLIDDTLTFPNGVLLSPDEKSLYVSQSDPSAPIIIRYRLGPGYRVENKETFYDFSRLMKPEVHGLPDGMSIDRNGIIFSTGPGGIYTFNDEGVLLGKMNLDRASSNCAFGEDGTTLFVTNQNRVIKIKTKTSGLKWL